MKSSSLNLAELLDRPDFKDQVSPEQRQRIAERFSQAPQTEPLYLQILAGAGAWFSSVFLLAALGVMELFSSSAGMICCGILFLTGAVLFSRRYRKIYWLQLLLALAFAGTILIPIGVVEAVDDHECLLVLIVHAAVCAVVCPCYSSQIYRFLAPLGLAILTLVWIMEEEHFYLIHLLIFLEFLLTAALFLRPRRSPALAPLAYSVATMLPGTLLFLNIILAENWWQDFTEPLWPSSLLLGLGLIGLYIRLAGPGVRLGSSWMTALISATLLLAGFTTPGLLAALGLLILGFAFQDRFLTLLALLFFPCFLAVYYYTLDIDLAHKSWIIAGSGLLLLAARWVAGRLEAKEAAK